MSFGKILSVCNFNTLPRFCVLARRSEGCLFTS